MGVGGTGGFFVGGRRATAGRRAGPAHGVACRVLGGGSNSWRREGVDGLVLRIACARRQPRARRMMEVTRHPESGTGSCSPRGAGLGGLNASAGSRDSSAPPRSRTSARTVRSADTNRAVRALASYDGGSHALCPTTAASLIATAPSGRHPERQSSWPSVPARPSRSDDRTPSLWHLSPAGDDARGDVRESGSLSVRRIDGSVTRRSQPA